MCRMGLCFRIREGGAIVFRIVEDAMRLRLDLAPLADGVVRAGAVMPRGGAVIAANMAAECLRSFPDDADRTMAKSACERMPMAMHDLRGAILRFQAEDPV